MIDPVSTQLVPLNTLRPGPAADGLDVGALRVPDRTGETGGAERSSSGGGTFSDLVGGLVRAVDAKSKQADTEVRHLMLGESDNIHRSMIAMQEAGLSFSLLVEVRNKLVESYQELMRMPV
jgi:flagellar hook-basal body complex protein FliE